MEKIKNRKTEAALPVLLRVHPPLQKLDPQVITEVPLHKTPDNSPSHLTFSTKMHRDNNVWGRGYAPITVAQITLSSSLASS